MYFSNHLLLHVLQLALINLPARKDPFLALVGQSWISQVSLRDFTQQRFLERLRLRNVPRLDGKIRPLGRLDAAVPSDCCRRRLCIAVWTPVNTPSLHANR